ncbi:unnamed protein product, partial [Candidula unifasciata]
FIKPRKLEGDDKPLKLVIEHGRRRFDITLKLADNEIGSRISLRHLAETVYCQTGIMPKEQKYYYKGITWENPEMGPWSPSLRSLGVRNGDKIQLVSFHHAYPDWEQIASLESVDKDIKDLRGQLSRVFYHVQGVQQGYMEGGNQVMALTFLRRDFENIKEKLMENIQILNSLNFDHRNALGQAKRRELVDFCQRQIDKCSDMSAYIFHKLAQAHYLSNVGKIYTHDFRLSPSSNKWAKKKQ